MVPCAADMELVLRIIGFFGIIVGAILFRDKSGRGSGKRIIQIFTVIGGSIAVSYTHLTLPTIYSV